MSSDAQTVDVRLTLGALLGGCLASVAYVVRTPKYYVLSLTPQALRTGRFPDIPLFPHLPQRRFALSLTRMYPCFNLKAAERITTGGMDMVRSLLCLSQASSPSHLTSHHQAQRRSPHCGDLLCNLAVRSRRLRKSPRTGNCYPVSAAPSSGIIRLCIHAPQLVGGASPFTNGCPLTDIL